MAKRSTLLTAFLFLTFLSCKRNGDGGEAMITVYVNHSGNPVNHPTVYIKYGAKSQPADPGNDYDKVYQGVHENHLHIKNLHYGNYYVFAVGYDSIAQKAVAGGTAVKIRWSKRKLDTEAFIEASD